MANCYDTMNRPLEAIFHFERFLDEAPEKSAKRQEVEKALQRLKKSIGELTLQVVPDGASVRIDQSEQRRTPILEPIRLTAGKHLIEVSHPDYRPASRIVDVVGGKPMQISIVLQLKDSAGAQAAIAPLPVEEPVAEPEPQPKDESPVEEPEPAPEETVAAETVVPEPEYPEVEEKSFSTGSGTLIAGAATAVLGVATIVTGIMAISADQDFDALAADSKNTSLTPLQREQARLDAEYTAQRADGLALATDLLLAATVISGGFTLYFLFTEKKAPEQYGDETALASTRISAALAPGSTALFVDGRF
jgi:hypothetical protein